MPHIHTQEGQHDLTASAFIVRADFDEPKLLLHWHKKLHKYLQFGGHVELDENPWQALAHELPEEAGYGLGQLKVLQPKDRIKDLPGTIMHPHPLCVNTHDFPATDYKHSHIDLAYAFVTTEEPQAQIAEGESDRFGLFTRQELLEIPDEDIVENVRKMGLYIFDVCYATWEQVSTSEFEL